MLLVCEQIYEGDGGSRQYLADVKRQVEDLGLEDRCRFVGKRDDIELI